MHTANFFMRLSMSTSDQNFHFAFDEMVLTQDLKAN